MHARKLRPQQLWGKNRPIDHASSGLTSKEVRAQYQGQAEEDHSRDFGRVVSYNCGRKRALSAQHFVFMHTSLKLLHRHSIQLNA